MKLLKSVSIGFRVEKKPPPFPPASRKFAPILEIDAPIFEIAAVNEDSPMIFAAPPIFFSMASRNIWEEICPSDAISFTCAAVIPAASANH